VKVPDHLRFTQSLLDDIEVPEWLYHYTNPDSLIAIIDSRAFWGGIPVQMNDTMEVRQAVEAMQFAAKVAERESQSAVTKEFARSVLGSPWLEPILSKLPAVFAVSFSQEKDSLSQWRAYCDRSGGVCLELPGELVATEATRVGWELAPCIYKQSDADKMMWELFEHHAQLYATEAQQYLPRPDDEWTTPDRVRRDALRGLLKDVQYYGAFIKNDSFAAEAEWRLIRVAEDEDLKNLKFRGGRDGVRSFLPVRLLPENRGQFTTEPRPRVRLGPSAAPGTAHFSTARLLEGWLGAGNAVVVQTSSSYR